jgi:hypothetical protein
LWLSWLTTKKHHNYFISSFLLAQKRTKKGSQSLGPPVADYPVLLKKEGRCETRHFQRLRQSSRYSFFFCAARLREMALNYILLCHYLGQPLKICLKDVLPVLWPICRQGE